MFLGIDLIGEERERYEAVRAARIKMERDGTPSPYVRCQSDEYCQARGISNDAPRIAPKLLEWLGDRSRFRASDAARDLGCCLATIYKSLTYLRDNGYTNANTKRGGNSRKKRQNETTILSTRSRKRSVGIASVEPR